MAKPILDTEWHQLITRRHGEAIPDDPEVNRMLYTRFWEDRISPHGCGLHRFFQNEPEGLHWQCKFSLGGQQRILGYGTCYQMAVLYDAAKVFFAKYRPNRKNYAWTRNFSEAETVKRLSDNLFLRSFMENIEIILNKRGELVTPEVREAKLSDRQHSYTTAGQLRYAIENILSILERVSASIAVIESQLKTPPAYHSPTESLLAEYAAVVAPRLKLTSGQNQVIESLKQFFASNPDVTVWSGSTLDLYRLVKSSIFNYNSNKLVAELEELKPNQSSSLWSFSRDTLKQPEFDGDLECPIVACKNENSVQ